MEFLLALQFLTRVPVKINHSFEERKLGRAMAFFPIVGLLLGIGAAIIYTILANFLEPPIVDLIVIIFLIVVTGNMHLDGLMDSADGLFSGRPREGILEVMKDSNVGAHGVIAGCLAVILKVVLLGHIAASSKGLALVIVLVLGRWAQVYAATFYPYARSGPGKSLFTHYVGKREMILASLVTLTVVVITLGYHDNFLAGIVPIGVVLGTTLIGTIVFTQYLSKKIGGITGDILGALNEITEVLGLFILQLLF